jgi:hypothetical protein
LPAGARRFGPFGRPGDLLDAVPDDDLSDQIVAALEKTELPPTEPLLPVVLPHVIVLSGWTWCHLLSCHLLSLGYCSTEYQSGRAASLQTWG